MRDIKFATVFPSRHPRAGEPTHFVEKIWEAVPGDNILYDAINYEVLRPYAESFQSKKMWTPKRTTIRAGHRWKKGDMFMPKIWTGIPYRSKPIAICEPLEVLDVEDFTIGMDGIYWLNDDILTLKELEDIALVDGFDEVNDFELWFNVKKGQTFDGQRIRFA